VFLPYDPAKSPSTLGVDVESRYGYLRCKFRRAVAEGEQRAQRRRGERLDVEGASSLSSFGGRPRPPRAIFCSLIVDTDSRGSFSPVRAGVGARSCRRCYPTPTLRRNEGGDIAKLLPVVKKQDECCEACTCPACTAARAKRK
jgi:hypothetical protein